MLLTILAWYTVVFNILGLTGTITNNEKSGGMRLAAVTLFTPVLIFAVLFLRN